MGGRSGRMWKGGGGVEGARGAGGHSRKRAVSSDLLLLTKAK